MNGRPNFILIPKQLKEMGFEFQHYEPDDAMAEALIHSAKTDARRTTFASVIATIPQAERTYTWRITNADADLGRGSSVALHPDEESLAHALLLNKFLVAADLIDAVPITGKHYIHALVSEKYRVAQAARATTDGAEAQSISNPALNPIAVQVINAIVADEDLDRRSEAEIVEYKEKHRRLFDTFSYTVRKLVKQVSALPGSSDFDRQVSELVNTEVWRDKTEVERELRDALAGFLALSENSTGGPFHAAFLKATNSVLVAAMRWALSSK
jgi:hypothetical protein